MTTPGDTPPLDELADADDDQLGWDVDEHGRMRDHADEFEPPTSRWRNMLDEGGGGAVPDPST